MKIEFNRPALVEALGLLTTVVPSRTPKPILKCLRICTCDNAVQISATDLEAGINYRISAVQVKEDGEVVIPAETLAEGVKVSTPVRGAAILSRLTNNKGKMIAITETKLRKAYIELACLGIYCEPTSALVWAAAGEVDKTFSAPTVAIITGSGYKSNLYLTGIV